MSRRRMVLVALTVSGVIVLGATALRILPIITGPALPSGAARLHLATEGPSVTFGCAAALLAPARVASSGGELLLVSAETGRPLKVVWPSGFAGWRLDERSVLADPWGGVVGRDGDVLDGLSGGVGVDDAFHICPFGIVTQP